MRTLLVLTMLAGCGARPAPAPTGPAPVSRPLLEVVAESPRRWTGIAVRPSGTIVVNYPRWSDDVPISVAELDPSGTPIPFPDAAWNAWARGDDPASAWVCVQSVHVDRDGTLWVLDPGNPRFEGVIDGAPKLVAFAPGARTPTRVYPFAPPAITPGSYLNDVRVDLGSGTAFLTDSGDGAIVVLDLATGDARRLLDDHPSTNSEDVALTIGGATFVRDGQAPRIHSDGIALTDDGWLYYQALTARTLYRIRAADLRDPALEPAVLASHVERVGETGAADGLLFHDGRVWLTAIEDDAIRTLTPGAAAAELMVSDPRLSWPDSLAAEPDGSVLVTTTQIHLGDHPPEPYRILRIRRPHPEG